MHQAILAQARHDRERLADCRLRFVRSSSAPLPPRIFAELERTFETPVIEWYGMTETDFLAHRMQSAAAAPAQGRLGRHTGGFGCRDHGRTRGFAARGQTGRSSSAALASWRATTATRWRPRPRLPAIGSRQAILVSSTTTGTCFSWAAHGRSSIAAGRKSPRRKSTKCCWTIRRWQRP